MKAARYYGPGDIRIESIPEPTPGPNQVKIKIAWTGICGSDLHCYLAPFVKVPTATIPDKLSGETLPITLGHEFSGTITELGPGADTDTFHIGKNVVVEPIVSCMEPDCQPCNDGTRNLCPLVNCIGIGGFGGGLAEYITVHQRHVYVIPLDIPLEIGALIEPMAVAWYAVKRSNYRDGIKAAVYGAGPIGLLVLKTMKVLDPHGHVVVYEPAEIRRRFAIQHGATEAINPKDVSDNAASEAVFDIVFDAAGTQETMNDAIRTLRARGQLVIVASWEKPPSVDMNSVLLKELEIQGSNTYSGIHPALIRAVHNGSFSDLESLITSKVELDDVVENGIKKLLNNKDSEIKILVRP